MFKRAVGIFYRFYLVLVSHFFNHGIYIFLFFEQRRLHNTSKLLLLD